MKKTLLVRLRLTAWISVGIALVPGFSRFSQAEQTAKKPRNVILLMMDGVRWQEVFQGVDSSLPSTEKGDLFNFLKNELGPSGIFFGDQARNATMTVSNPALSSLPGYQSIMAGSTQPCGSNACGRIRVETLQERIVRDLGVSAKEVATIASWEKIPLAVEHVAGTTFVNAADKPLEDGDSDSELEKLNREQAQDTPPWGSARWDRFTFAQALRYLKKHHPRFLFISLNDSDEWGHKGEYPKYLATLRQYDQWIKELTTELKAMGEYGENTTLLITTDHGRGLHSSWNEHGSGWPDSRYVWLFGKSPWMNSRMNSKKTAALKNSGTNGHTHLDIRPTVEAALGLEPTACEKCGQVIREIVPVNSK